MSKMGQYFLQLQEQGKVPWEPIGDNDDVQDREECKVPWQIEQPVEGHSAVGHGVPIQRNQKEYLSLASYISRFNRNNQPKQFSMKTYPQEGVRIFRLEDSEVEDNQQVQSTRASDESTDTGQLQQRGERQVSDPVDRQPTQTNPVQIPSG